MTFCVLAMLSSRKYSLKFFYMQHKNIVKILSAEIYLIFLINKSFQDFRANNEQFPYVYFKHKKYFFSTSFNLRTTYLVSSKSSALEDTAISNGWASALICQATLTHSRMNGCITAKVLSGGRKMLGFTFNLRMTSWKTHIMPQTNVVL